jgi:nitroreductase
VVVSQDVGKAQGFGRLGVVSDGDGVTAELGLRKRHTNLHSVISPYSYLITQSDGLILLHPSINCQSPKKENAKVNTLDAIAARRSIRKFKSDPLPGETLQAILTAATQAPSGKNRQPWRFVVVKGDKRAEMVCVMREGIAKAKAQGENPGSSVWSANVMEQAPVTVFVFNPRGTHPWLAHSVDQMFNDVVDIQSIGAAIQNMLLAAQDLGVGSLWICDVFYAYEELCTWLGEKGQMIAAVSLGYADESPEARSRKPVGEVTRWL